MDEKKKSAENIIGCLWVSDKSALSDDPRWIEEALAWNPRLFRQAFFHRKSYWALLPRIAPHKNVIQKSCAAAHIVPTSITTLFAFTFACPNRRPQLRKEQGGTKGFHMAIGQGMFGRTVHQMPPR